MASTPLLLFVMFISAIGSGEKLDIDALQNQFGNRLQPELRVREIDDRNSREFALLTTIQVNQGRFEFFNPFGDEVIGRCYRVAVVDAEGFVVRNIVPTTAAAPDLAKHDSWLHVYRNGLVGRCHTLPADTWKGIAAGHYSLVLIVNRRMIHGSPQSFRSSPRKRSWEESWRDHSQDTPLCGSPPVSVEIDNQGNCHFPDIRRLEAVDVESTVSEKRELSISVKIISPDDSWMMIRGMNVYDSMTRSLSETVTKEDGSTALRSFRPPGGTSGPGVSEESDAVLVPRHGIVGGVLLHGGSLEPGKYRVAVRVHESIYKDKLFVHGKKVDRDLADWPVRFQSMPRELVVE
jgi:hypothetical protein